MRGKGRLVIDIMHVHSNKYGSGATLFINEVLFYLFSGSGVPNEMHRYFNGTTSISTQSVPETSDAVDMFIGWFPHTTWTVWM